MDAQFEWTSNVDMDDMASWFRDMEDRLETAMEEHAAVGGVTILADVVSNAPKDTGKLAGTMEVEVEQASDTEVIIFWGNDEAEYAGIVEFTQPFLAPTIRENKGTIRSTLEAIHEDVMDK